MYLDEAYFRVYEGYGDAETELVLNGNGGGGGGRRTPSRRQTPTTPAPPPRQPSQPTTPRIPTTQPPGTTTPVRHVVSGPPPPNFLPPPPERTVTPPRVLSPADQCAAQGGSWDGVRCHPRVIGSPIVDPLLATPPPAETVPVVTEAVPGLPPLVTPMPIYGGGFGPGAGAPPPPAPGAPAPDVAGTLAKIMAIGVGAMTLLS